jgi:hypothetical protein
MAPRTPKDPEKKPAKASKPAAPKPAAAKAAPAKRPAAAKPALKVVEKPAAPAPGGKAGVLKLKDLVDQVASSTGAKKPEAKKAVEAVLTALSTALKSGTDLALPPLGKLRIAKTAGAVMTLKLRSGAGDKAGAKPLADDGEDD